MIRFRTAGKFWVDLGVEEVLRRRPIVLGVIRKGRGLSLPRHSRLVVY